jgi:hypothetical protein
LWHQVNNADVLTPAFRSVWLRPLEAGTIKIMSNCVPFPENRDRNALVLELWSKGLSFGRIAADLAVSRNIVAGVVSRAQRRGRAVKRITRERKPMAPRPRMAAERARAMAVARWAARVLPPLPVLPAPAAPAPALPHPVLSLPSGTELTWHSPRGCTFIVNGDTCAPAWCNAPAVPRLSWCAFHLEVVASR